ncbi:PQQ-binding-like beta-propeller repeat protein [Nocardia sp. NPDC050406]|uniref:outer membrane protein assembly factor BamB family protein n=1 Tax=Nocardia sp. NPDC050406 TaxID=3364318 RepID=UPI0037B8181C
MDRVVRIGHNAAVTSDDPRDFHSAAPVPVRLTKGDPPTAPRPTPPVRRRTALIAGLAAVGGAVCGAGALTLPKLFDRETVPGTPVADPTVTAGQIRWRAAVPVRTDMDWTPPAVVAGTVFATAENGILHALDTATGKTRWTAVAGANIDYGPLAVAGVVIVATELPLVAFDASTGERRWRTEDATTTGQLCASADGGVVYAMASGRPYVRGVSAIDSRTGRILWMTPTGGASGPLDLSAGAGIVAAVDGEALVALDAATGALRWRTEIQGFMAKPTVGANTVVVAGASTGLEVFDLASGAPLWTARAHLADYAAVAGDLTYAGGGYWVGSYETTTVQAFDTRTGRLRWSKGKTGAPPVVVNATVFTAEGRKVSALDAATGSQRWECDIGMATSAVAANDDTAFVYGDGYVYAIAL